jgi:hypothetical protein
VPAVKVALSTGLEEGTGQVARGGFSQLEHERLVRELAERAAHDVVDVCGA